MVYMPHHLKQSIQSGETVIVNKLIMWNSKHPGLADNSYEMLKKLKKYVYI